MDPDARMWGSAPPARNLLKPSPVAAVPLSFHGADQRMMFNGPQNGSPNSGSIEVLGGMKFVRGSVVLAR
jgi:hypothetical protein